MILNRIVKILTYNIGGKNGSSANNFRNRSFLEFRRYFS